MPTTNIKHRFGFDGIPYSEDRTIDRPATPSVWTNKESIRTRITRIRITYGGGLGGANIDEYVLRFPSERLSDPFVTLTRYADKKEFTVNTSNIVLLEDFEVISKEIISENEYFGKGQYDLDYLCEPGVNLKFINKL